MKDFKAFTERLTADGQKLDVALTGATARMGLKIAFVTYVLHKGETGWKIAVIILHDAHQSPSHGKSSG